MPNSKRVAHLMILLCYTMTGKIRLQNPQHSDAKVSSLACMHGQSGNRFLAQKVKCCLWLLGKEFYKIVKNVTHSRVLHAIYLPWVQAQITQFIAFFSFQFHGWFSLKASNLSPLESAKRKRSFGGSIMPPWFLENKALFRGNNVSSSARENQSWEQSNKRAKLASISGSYGKK